MSGGRGGPPLVVLGHGAERTGPPIFLLRLLTWIRAHTEVDVEVLLLTGGPLLAELRALAPVSVAGAGPARPGTDDLPVVYVNTAGSIAALRLVGVPPARIVTHVHELSTGLDPHLSPDLRSVLLARTDRFLAVADVVADELVARYGIDRSRVAVHRGFVTPDPPPTTATRAGLGLGPGPVVVAAGTIDWRKGADLFLQVVPKVLAAHPAPVQFVWVGGDLTSPVARSIVDDVRRLGLGSSVRFVGEQPDPDQWFAHADVFLLPSREDAFPLVCLEAARHGVPIVCFDAGGEPEFVRDDAGVVIPFPDCTAMADAVAALLADDARRHRLGATAAERVRLDHDPDVVVPRLLDELLGPDWREDAS